MLTRLGHGVVVAIATVPVFARTAAAAQRIPGDTLLTVASYVDLEQVGNPQISPDGKTIVYTRSWIDRANDKWDNAVWVMNADGTRNRFLVKGSSPIWSPDGSRIAYVAQAEAPKGPQIFVRWMDAEGAASQVTRVTETPGNLKWSPDGKAIAFTQLVPKSDEWPIELPAPSPNGKWTEAPRIVSKLHYRFDRTGFLKSGFLHLFLVSADGGTPRQLTSGDWNVGAANEGIPFGVGYDFSPDGKTLYFDGNDDSRSDLAYRESNIYALDLGTLAMKRLNAEKGRWARPTVSPDGSTIAFSGHLPVKQTYKVADLWVMNRDGSGARNLTASYDRDLGFGLFWSPDGKGVYGSPENEGSINAAFVPVAGGPVRAVTTGAQVLRVTSISRTGDLVGLRSSSHQPPEAVRIAQVPNKPAEIVQLTNVNDDLLAGRRLGAVEEIWYPSSGGARIQGWIVKPPSFDSRKKYPLVLEIHGGPHGMYNVGFDYMWQSFAAHGYVVLYTNPRGSTGYGTAFGNAIDQAYPSVDYDDLMAGVDTIVGRGYIDTRQLFVGGCSGGGILSSWVIGHTTRFSGAAVRCPITNWISAIGTTDIPFFGSNFFGKPFWEDPSQWLKQSSLMYVGNVTTPTLLMTGELDLRTPMAQSEEYFAALKMRGVPTALVRFNGEWHGTSSLPSNWMRTMLYMMSWYKKYGSSPTS